MLFNPTTSAPINFETASTAFSCDKTEVRIVACVMVFFSWLVLANSALAVDMTMPRQFTADLVRNDDSRYSRFDSVVARAQAGPAFERVRFAELAIRLIIESYEQELAPDGLALVRADAKEQAWRRGMQRYLEQLRAIEQLVPLVEDVVVVRETHGDVRLVVGSEQLMVSTPRPTEQGRLEQVIAELSCQYDDCDHNPVSLAANIERQAQGISTKWQFAKNQEPRLTTSDGLECVFDKGDGLNVNQRRCERLLGQLRLLAQALRSLTQHGQTIDWQAIRLEHVGDGVRQKLIYNEAAQFVRMNLPDLLRGETILRGAIPWLRANLAGHSRQHIVSLKQNIAQNNVKEKDQHGSH